MIQTLNYQCWNKWIYSILTFFFQYLLQVHRRWWSDVPSTTYSVSGQKNVFISTNSAMGPETVKMVMMKEFTVEVRVNNAASYPDSFRLGFGIHKWISSLIIMLINQITLILFGLLRLWNVIYPLSLYWICKIYSCGKCTLLFPAYVLCIRDSLFLNSVK